MNKKISKIFKELGANDTQIKEAEKWLLDSFGGNTKKLEKALSEDSEALEEIKALAKARLRAIKMGNIDLLDKYLENDNKILKNEK